LIEVVKKHPVKGSPLGMPRTIHSRHSGRKDSRNGPVPRNGPCLSGRRGGVPGRRPHSG
jgi:hypothetical protein